MSADIFDITFADGFVTPGRRRNKLDGTTAPTATDDSATGYELNSVWIDVTNDKAYICVDPTAGAAVWKQVGGESGGSLFIDLAVSGAYTIDRGNGETQDLTLTGDATFTLAGALTGEATDIRLLLRQDATGGRTVTWPTITWAGGAAPTLQTAADAVDTIGLLTVDDGVTWFGYFDQSGSPASTVTDETAFGIAAAVGTDTEYARQDHTHGTPADPVTAAAVKAQGRWEPVQQDDASAAWPFVYKGGEIVVAWIDT